MRKNGLLITVALASLAGGALIGCSLEDVPHAPTFAADIKPIMLSRCVRCHGAGGGLHGDPQSTNPAYRGAPIDGHFDRMEDDCPDMTTSGCHGLGHYTTGGTMTVLVGYIHRTNPKLPMPPLPSPPLTTNQLDIIDLWLANGAPAE